MKIGIDIDGVILDFERQMHYEAALYDFKIHGKGKISDNFNYLSNYNWTESQKKTFIKKYLIEGTKKCSLIPGSKESIDILHNLDHKIIIITARGTINKNTIKVVDQVLKKYNIYYDEIHYSITNKTNICHNLHIDYMIDDNPETCFNLSTNKIKTIYFKDNPRKLRNNKYLKTVSNWAEILNYITKNK